MQLMSQKGIRITQKLFRRCSKLTKIKIPSYVKKICCKAFEKCTSLKEVVYEEPSSLLFIGAAAFMDCTSLKQISIPPTVLLIGWSAFENCKSLTRISIPSKATLVDDLFDKCSPDLERTTLESPEESEQAQILAQFIPHLFSGKYANDLKSYNLEQDEINDDIITQIVDVFKSNPILLKGDDAAELMMDELTKSKIESVVKNYFSGFYSPILDLRIYLISRQRFYPFSCSCSDKISTVYNIVGATTDDGVNHHKVTFCNKVLDDALTFNDYQIESNNVLIVTQTMRGYNAQ